MGHTSATAGEFDNLARHPKIASSSELDAGEPTSHANGFTASFNQMKNHHHSHAQHQLKHKP